MTALVVNAAHKTVHNPIVGSAILLTGGVATIMVGGVSLLYIVDTFVSLVEWLF